MYLVGLEVKKRLDDSYYGFSLIEQYRNTNSFGKIAFLGRSQYDRPYNDNLMYGYDGTWKVDYNSDYRTNFNNANLKFKISSVQFSAN